MIPHPSLPGVASKGPSVTSTAMNIDAAACTLERCKFPCSASEISLLPKIISLLIFVGNLPANRCGTGAFRTVIASKSPEIAKFPVIFPVSRELQVETGSHMTAHTTKSFKNLAI
jgi:hypothetical protein